LLKYETASTSLVLVVTESFMLKLTILHLRLQPENSFTDQVDLVIGAAAEEVGDSQITEEEEELVADSSEVVEVRSEGWMIDLPLIPQ